MMVHVDGDVIVYRAGYAAEHTLYHLHWREKGKQRTEVFDGAREVNDFLAERKLGPLDYMMETEVVVEDESAAVYNTRSIIAAIATELQVDLDTEVRVYLSGPDNYRNGIATVKPYKGNRDKDRKPVHAPAIKQYIRSRYMHQTSDGQEADDDMAIAHYTLYVQDPGSTVIATIDKDLDTVPGMHFNFVTKQSYVVSDEEADRFFWQQMMQGDTVDNIPGLHGWGKIKSRAFIDKHWPNVYAPIRELYREAYGEKGDEVLTEMGRLLYIRRRANEWWNPPKEDGNG